MPATQRIKDPAAEQAPIEQRIRQRAYELYLQRGGDTGYEMDDWLQAEQEIMEQQEQEHGREAPRAAHGR